MYKKAIIYFLSGTGNSYRIAVWLHEACKNRGIESEVVPLALADPSNEIAPSRDTLVAFAYPTHGLMPPWSAIKFLFRMPVRKSAHFIALPTRGCFHIGPVPIPGGAGLASILPALVLPFKGYNVRGALSFDMPVNIVSFFPVPTKKGIEKIIARAKRKADKYYPVLLGGKPLRLTKNNLWEALWSIPMFFNFPLLPASYLLIGRFFMGKLMFANYDCAGCGICAASCSSGAIIMKGKINPRPFWKYNCEDCLRCMNYCPNNAVETGHSWAVLLTLVTAIPVSAFIFDLITFYWPELSGFRNPFTVKIIKYAYYFPAVIIAYSVFFRLLRFKPVNAFFTFTTLTHIYHRYKEPGTSLKDLTRKTR